MHERCTPVTCTCRKPQDPRVGHSKASSGGPRSTEKSIDLGAVRIFEVPAGIDERAWLETVTAPVDAAEATLQLAVATDQQRYPRDGHVKVSGDLRSAGPERFVDWYVVLRRVGGPLVYWAPLARGAWLHPESGLLRHPSYPMPDIPLAGLLPGPYRIEMIVAEPYTQELLGWAHAGFTIDP